MAKVGLAWCEGKHSPQLFWNTLQKRLERPAMFHSTEYDRGLEFFGEIASDEQIKLGMLRYMTDTGVTTPHLRSFLESFRLGWNQLDDKHGEWWWRYYDEDDENYQKFDAHLRKKMEKWGKSNVNYLTEGEFARYKEFVDETMDMGMRPKKVNDFEWMVERDPDVATAFLIVELEEYNLLEMLTAEQIRALPVIKELLDKFRYRRSNPFDNSLEWEYRSELLDALKKVW